MGVYVRRRRPAQAGGRLRGAGFTVGAGMLLGGGVEIRGSRRLLRRNR